MTETERKRMKERIAKRLGKEFTGSFWKWRGSEFINFGFEGVDGATARYEFHIKMLTLKAVVQTQENYNIPDSVHMFVGENAIEECIEWTAEKLLELYETVSARTEPYKQGYRDYQRALQGR